MVKVKGSGERCVFSRNICFSKYYFPDEVWIDEVKQDKVERQYNLKKEENNIKLLLE